MAIEIKIPRESEQRLTTQIVNGLTATSARTLYSLRGDIKALYDKTTPMKSGALRYKVETRLVTEKGKDDVLSFIYKQPYARYQYTHHFKHYTTPGTDGEWDLKAEYKVKQLVFEEYVKQCRNYFK